jgi:site-specific DNA-methyltransferase (adenine-specific)
MGTLYSGDNLEILREHVKDETVDLVYLDPPFNSNASYNVLFRAPEGHESHAQMEAFEDTWHWNAPAEKAFDEVISGGNADHGCAKIRGSLLSEGHPESGPCPKWC